MIDTTDIHFRWDAAMGLVPTPPKLATEMASKLVCVIKRDAIATKKLYSGESKFLFAFAKSGNLILAFNDAVNREFGIDATNMIVAFFPTRYLRRQFLKTNPKFEKTAFVCNFLTPETWPAIYDDVKFDAIVGNPPYQTHTNGNSRSIWDRFFINPIMRKTKSGKLVPTGKVSSPIFDHLIDRGYLCIVHPSGWRNVDGDFKEVADLIKSHDVWYLEIHNKADGNRTFGASTPYDWYVLQKRESSDKTGVKTEVKFQDGVVKTLDLTKLPFIPNGSFDRVMELVAKKGEKTVEILRDCNYHTQQDHVAKEKSSKFRYPVIYTVKSGDIANCRFSSRKVGHFGIPKVIWSNGGITMGVLVDSTGEYGLTEFAYAIVDEPKNLPKIKEAITSDAFKKLIIESTDDGSINRRVLALFRKDFWKDFI